LTKLLNIKNEDNQEDCEYVNTNIKLFMTRRCLISQNPAYEFTVIGDVVRAASIFDFGRDIIVTAERTTGKFLFWNIKRNGDEFKEIMLCYVIKCNFLYFCKKIITFVYMQNLDKITFCVASQHSANDNNTVLFELNSNEIEI
jgi:hypothetical protein